LLLIDGKASEVDVRSNGYDNGRVIFMKGAEIAAEIEDYRLALVKKSAGIKRSGSIDKELRAPMPGLVLELKASEKDQISKGETLLIIEAMKMENVIKAPSDVIIKRIKVEAGASIEKGDCLMEFE